MTEVCRECSGTNIRQQVSVMIDPNNVPPTIKIGDVWFDDYYYCNDCKTDCGVDEKD